MTVDDCGSLALFRGRPPAGFSRRVLRLPPGARLEAERLAGAIVFVKQGLLELECRAGGRRRFGRGSMIPFAGPRLVHLHNPGLGPLVLVAVSRIATDEFSGDSGSHSDD